MCWSKRYSPGRALVLCARGADRGRFCASAGLRAGHGRPLRAAQPRHRYVVHVCRSAHGEAIIRGAVATSAAALAPCCHRRWLRHAKYVLMENPLTLVALGGFTLLCLLAILGPSLAPYDPLASETASARCGPLVRLVRHRPARPRHLQSCTGGHPARLLHRARCREPTVRDRQLSRCLRRLSRWTGRSRRRRVWPTPSWRSPCSCSRWASWRRWATP